MPSIAKKFAFAAALGLVCLCLAGAALAATTAELIAQGDALYAQRADLAKAKEAAGLYQQALTQDPKSEEARLEALPCPILGGLPRAQGPKAGRIPKRGGRGQKGHCHQSQKPAPAITGWG